MNKSYNGTLLEYWTSVSVINVSVPGIIGNFISFLIILNNRSNYISSFRKVLLCLTASDFLFLFHLLILHFSYLDKISLDFKDDNVRRAVTLFFNYAEGGSKYFTVAISFERLIVIGKPAWITG
jgi:hypothetical protein